MKKRFALIFLSLTLLVMGVSFFGHTQTASAAPDSAGKYLEVKLTGSIPSGATVTAAYQNQKPDQCPGNITLASIGSNTYQSGNLCPWQGSNFNVACTDPTTNTGNYIKFDITVKNGSGQTVGTGNITADNCGRNGATINVSNTPVAAGNLSGKMYVADADGNRAAANTCRGTVSEAGLQIKSASKGITKTIRVANGDYSVNNLPPANDYKITGTVYGVDCSQNNGGLSREQQSCIQSDTITIKNGETTKLFIVADTSKGSNCATATVASDTDPGAGTGGGTLNGVTPDDCDTTFTDPLSWFICPVVNGINTAVKGMDNAINNLLTVDTQKIFDTTDPNGSGAHYYKAWLSFRNFALGLIFIAAMIIIISTALGYEILDAYTIRKTLPRFLIAILFIVLSWSAMQFFITLSNDAGNGIRALIYAPFSDMPDLQLGIGSQVLGDLLLGAGLLVLGPIALLSFGVTALLGVLVAFLVLVLRELVIVFLVIVAPVGIAAMMLPNTRRVWDLWQKTMTSLLVAFPIIAGMIAIGRVFSVTTYAGGTASTLQEIIAFVAYILPYFALPFALRLAGGLLATLTGLANDRSRGAFDRLKGFRANESQKNLQKLKAGNRFNEDHIAAPLTRRFNNFSRGAGNIGAAGYNPRRMRSRLQSTLSNHAYDEAAEAREKNSALRSVIGNDDYNNAVMHSLRTYGNVNDKGVREHLQGIRDRNGNQVYAGQGLEQGVAAVREARRTMTAEGFAVATTVANAGTGTGYGGGEAEMLQAINQVAGDDRHLANRMLAESRGLADRANRVDLAGPGFGGQGGRMQRLYEGTVTAADSNSEAASNALFVKGMGQIMNARGNAVQNLAPQILQEFTQVASSGDQHAIDTELARIAGIYDAMGQSAPENARIMANTVLGAGIIQNTPAGPVTVTVRQMMEDARDRGSGSHGEQTFLELRREYRNAAMAQVAAAGGAPPGGVGAPPPGGGGPGAPGP